MSVKVMKKVRGSNFTKEEELLLLEEVKKEMEIIECKVTNKISTFEKEKAWKRVVDCFNSKNSTSRNMNQLKTKYDNLRTKARKVVANKKAQCSGTGGGPFLGDGFDPVVEAVLNCINIKTVVGLRALYDSDMHTTDSLVTPSTSKAEVITLPPVNQSEPVIIDILEGAEVLSIQDNVKATDEIPTNSSHLPSDIILGDKTSQLENTGDWCNYVPRKLKKPITKQLRRPVPNCINAKEEFYKLKISLIQKELDEQQKRAEREKIEFDRKETEWHIKQEREKREEKRLEEEHEAKMRLLNLKIKEMEEKLNSK